MRRSLADSHDDRPVIVHLDLGSGADKLAQSLDVVLVRLLGLCERLIQVAVGKQLGQSHAIDDDRVGPAQVFGDADQHPPMGRRSHQGSTRRCPDHRGIVNADQDHLFDHIEDPRIIPACRRGNRVINARLQQVHHFRERVGDRPCLGLPVALELLGEIGLLLQIGRRECELGPRIALVERNGPLHSRHTPHTLEVALEHRLDVIHEPDAGFHYPQIGPRDVRDLCGRCASIRPQKIDPCCMISAAAKVKPRTMPRNLALSPTSIFKAIQYMAIPHDREL